MKTNTLKINRLPARLSLMMLSIAAAALFLSGQAVQASGFQGQAMTFETVSISVPTPLDNNSSFEDQTGMQLDREIPTDSDRQQEVEVPENDGIVEDWIMAVNQ